MLLSGVVEIRLMWYISFDGYMFLLRDYGVLRKLMAKKGLNAYYTSHKII